MTLVEDMMEEVIFLNKVKVDDGEGGFYTTYEDGLTFMAAVTRDTTMQTRVAEKEGVTSVYTVTTRRNVKLDFHDVIKKKSDGSIYRITSKGGEQMTPPISTLDLSQVTAEGWSLTT